MTGGPPARPLPARSYREDFGYPEDFRYPEDFGIVLDPGVRRPAPNVLIGGSPLRVIRLSGRGTDLLDSWLSGQAVGSDRPAQRLARRLTSSCIANPLPPAGTLPTPEDVTVVVPVRDRPSGLRSTLSSLSGLDVVVVDDASQDPVRACSHRVVRRHTHGGPAAARNTGWRSVDSAIVVFLDADCVPVAGWLDVLLGHFSDPLVGAVAPRVASAHGPGLVARYETVMSPLDMGADGGTVMAGGRIPYVPTACLAVRRRAIELCGGFDETLRFGEDVDLVWRLVATGWSVRYEPRAVVSHPPRSSLRSWARQRFEYGRSAAPLSARHGSCTAPAALSPWSAAVWGLVGVGRVPAGAALAGGLSALVAARAGQDAPTRRVLALLAARGHLLAGRSLATATRRAWTPFLLVGLFLRPVVRRRASAWLLAGFLVPLTEWAAPGGSARRAALGPLSWCALRWSDDLSYQAGLWAGSVEHRTLRALIPRWIRRPGRRFR